MNPSAAQISTQRSDVMRWIARTAWTGPSGRLRWNTQVHWYVHANAESPTSEAALTSAFIPLELLSWVMVVEDGRQMSRRQFEKLTTAQRVDQLLKKCGVSTRIPNDFAKLRGSDLAAKERTGPKCITAVRNALVHPRKAKRDQVGRLDSLVKFELKELALSYVELAFLRALGYRGRYARRILKGWKGSELSRVPWV